MCVRACVRVCACVCVCRVRVPAGSGEIIFFFRVNICAGSHSGIRSTAVAVDPGHSAKSAVGRLQINKHAPYVCGFA